MKRQISISILLVAFAIFLTLLYVKVINESKLQEERIQKNEQLVKKNTEESIAISQEDIGYMFYLQEEEGRLVVFHAKTKEKYMDTGIVTESLPENMKERLKSGIFFQTEGELYDFLESYSS